ncbi:response regulator transcription factor [Variovorax sp. GB1P17]|uniref:response regulator transcription factor n=1 Tax=Variovorax sp. GB1P17 TaxID=3443740 RepID=UPI003F48337C
MTFKILIVEDDALAWQRLQRIVAQVFAGCRCAIADSLAQARAQMTGARFDLALLDVGLPDGDGIDLLPWMQSHAPQTEAVIVSSLGDDATVLKALRSGAVGYLLKNGEDVEIELSLRSLQRGGAPIDPVIARRILQLVDISAAAPTAPALGNIAAAPEGAEGELTKREIQVLELVAQGLGNREIGLSLNITTNTVECHAKNIYRKLAVRTRSSAVHSARSRGLLP